MFLWQWFSSKSHPENLGAHTPGAKTTWLHKEWVRSSHLAELKDEINSYQKGTNVATLWSGDTICVLSGTLTLTGCTFPTWVSAGTVSSGLLTKIKTSLWGISFKMRLPDSLGGMNKAQHVTVFVFLGTSPRVFAHIFPSLSKDSFLFLTQNSSLTLIPIFFFIVCNFLREDITYSPA